MEQPVSVAHEMVYIQADYREAWVDEGIADDILMLWWNGVGTTYSCQGWPHLRQPYEAGLKPWQIFLGPEERYIALENAEDCAQAQRLCRGWALRRDCQLWPHKRYGCCIRGPRAS